MTPVKCEGKEDVIYHSGKWATIERGIWYLWELAVLEMIYYDLNNAQSPINPDEVQCMQPVWWKFVQCVGVPTAECIGDQNQPDWERVGKASHCDWLRGSVHPWHRGYSEDIKGYWWAFSIAALEMELNKRLSTLPSLSEDPSVGGLLRIAEQHVMTDTTTVHRWQYHTNRDSMIPIHKLICQLESHGVVGGICSPFNSPIENAHSKVQFYCKPFLSSDLEEGCQMGP